MHFKFQMGVSYAVICVLLFVFVMYVYMPPMPLGLYVQLLVTACPYCYTCNIVHQSVYLGLKAI